MSEPEITISQCSLSQERMTQPDGDGNFQVSDSLCSGLDFVCGVMSVGKRRKKNKNKI
jgi:hypothetical protein